MIRSMSRAPSGPGAPARGVDNSRCSVAAGGRLLIHATIASSASS
jgi:hypothetical protein